MRGRFEAASRVHSASHLSPQGYRDMPLKDAPMLEVLRRTSESVFVPLTVGGGIRDFTDRRAHARGAWGPPLPAAELHTLRSLRCRQPVVLSLLPLVPCHGPAPRQYAQFLCHSFTALSQLCISSWCASPLPPPQQREALRVARGGCRVLPQRRRQGARVLAR